VLIGLVHGAWHDARCWAPFADELRRRGLDAVAVDLPTEDPAATTADYARLADSAIEEAVGDTADDVVLVGHSMGGLTLPVVAALRPVRRMVFICALVPRPASSWDSVARAHRDLFSAELAAGQQVHEDGSTSWEPAAAADVLYSDCAPAVAAAQAARLRRQCWTPTRIAAPFTRWPDVESRYVVCAEDRALVPDGQRRLARELLAVEPIELPGGHSPFLSRPAALADVVLADLS
jgi:pimeloyl-ACP methyl ester carboxylesterase